jgi:hypothetical protein
MMRMPGFKLRRARIVAKPSITGIIRPVINGLLSS